MNLLNLQIDGALTAAQVIAYLKAHLPQLLHAAAFLPLVGEITTGGKENVDEATLLVKKFNLKVELKELAKKIVKVVKEPT